MVGRNSARGVLILDPKFSILIIVEEVMTFSFCGINPRVSPAGCAVVINMYACRIKKEMAFFKSLDIGVLR